MLSMYTCTWWANIVKMQRRDEEEEKQAALLQLRANACSSQRAHPFQSRESQLYEVLFHKFDKSFQCVMCVCHGLFVCVSSVIDFNFFKNGIQPKILRSGETCWTFTRCQNTWKWRNIFTNLSTQHFRKYSPTCVLSFLQCICSF